VLSTLHTNDAPSAIGRLRDIGTAPYLIASTLMGVMAQRLVRLLCIECREAYDPPLRVIESLFPNEKLPKSVRLYRPKGCDKCQNTGYWGRKGIYEMLIVNDVFRDQIQSAATVDSFKKLARSQGVKSLRGAGLDLVLAGLTTAEEVFRSTVE
jgi:type IV pilus assembly protein PilB